MRVYCVNLYDWEPILLIVLSAVSQLSFSSKLQIQESIRLIKLVNLLAEVPKITCFISYWANYIQTKIKDGTEKILHENSTIEISYLLSYTYTVAKISRTGINKAKHIFISKPAFVIVQCLMSTFRCSMIPYFFLLFSYNI